MTRPNFNRGAASLKRRQPRSEPSGKSYLIVTEGKKTEPNYLHAIRERLKLSATDVEIVHPPGTDPLTLTLRAKELKEKRKIESKRGTSILYDEVWVVLDLEHVHSPRRKQAREAIETGQKANISFAISDPCFEFWMLLHHEYTTSPFRDCDEVVTRIRKRDRTYTKGVDIPPGLLDLVAKAARHAERCRAHHVDSGGDGNPSTQFDILIRNLNQATRPHLQLDLD